jgi:hypothetical protein
MYKKIPAILLVASLLLACNAQNENNTASNPAAVTHEHTEKTSGLVLNNGARWKAGSTTLANAALLQTIVSFAKKESPENYMETATQLQDGLNKMVKECTMKGADHDALHHWLEPLMIKINEFKNAAAIENSVTIFNDFEKQVNLFLQYFEK